MDTRVARASYCLLVRESDDAFLIERARAGRDDAVRELFERYWPFAWKVAYAVTDNPALADDAAQGAMQRAFESLDRFDPRRPFAPWLKRIVVDQAIDELRRDSRVRAQNGHHHELLLASQAGDEVAGVAAAVSALTPEKRVVVVLPTGSTTGRRTSRAFSASRSEPWRRA